MLKIAPIDATLGAVVTDLDLARLDALTWNTVEQPSHDYAVLVFPGQSLSEEAQIGLPIASARSSCWLRTPNRRRCRSATRSPMARS